MTEPDESVQRFVDQYVSTGEGAVPLVRLWEEYEARTARPVPLERFKWHFLQSTPSKVSYDVGPDGTVFRGVKL